eukprot:TRINITY_DN4984_c0_g1_i1.p1 TRINITY_DN4984_c0_g1~~TRINITY_DN4984_c0_g1_i1.p1  ORF type:complete len:512 (-),score=113.58 TRINITY_DN4984_c0_g1_i1:103-1638(-)
MGNNCSEVLASKNGVLDVCAQTPLEPGSLSQDVDRIAAQVKAEIIDLHASGPVPVCGPVKAADASVLVNLDESALFGEVDTRVASLFSGSELVGDKAFRAFITGAVGELLRRVQQGSEATARHFFVTVLDRQPVRFDMFFFVSKKSHSMSVLAWALASFDVDVKHVEIQHLIALVDKQLDICAFDSLRTMGKAILEPRATKAILEEKSAVIRALLCRPSSDDGDAAAVLQPLKCVVPETTADVCFTQLVNGPSSALVLGIDTGILAAHEGRKLTLYYRFTASNCTLASFCKACNWWQAALPNILFEQRTTGQVHFVVADDDADPMSKRFAVSFFPRDLAGQAVPKVRCYPLLKDCPNQAGFLAHELGHILGFRHEHVFFAWRERKVTVIEFGKEQTYAWRDEHNDGCVQLRDTEVGDGEAAHLHDWSDKNSVMSYVKLFTDHFKLCAAKELRENSKTVTYGGTFTIDELTHATETQPSELDIKLAADVYKNPSTFQIPEAAVYCPQLHWCD